MSEALAIAALSARSLAEAATCEGFEPLALDLFGDADTRRAAVEWHPIGEAARMRIDEVLLLTALEAAAKRPGIAGWIAGSGFEGRDDLLARGAQCLPLLGTQPKAWAAVRDPLRFFAGLAAEGIVHAETRREPPADPAGWLRKDLHASGGWHVRHAADAAGPLGASEYFQREVAGVPMSATFVANGIDAFVLGFNRQRVTRIGARPFVFRGVVGPVRLEPSVASVVGEAVRAVARRFGLRGLGSLDFMLGEDGNAQVLEVNPRPPASLALYPRGAECGIVETHLRGCRGEPLPEIGGTFDGRVRGIEIVFARRASLRVPAAAAAQLAHSPHVHDLPAAGTRATHGDPLCSVSAEGPNVAAVEALLDERHDHCIALLETSA